MPSQKKGTSKAAADSSKVKEDAEATVGVKKGGPAKKPKSHMGKIEKEGRVCR